MLRLLQCNIPITPVETTLWSIPEIKYSNNTNWGTIDTNARAPPPIVHIAEVEIYDKEVSLALFLDVGIVYNKATTNNICEGL